MHVTVPELRIFLNLFVMNLFVMNFILHSVLLFDMRLLCGKYNSNFRELTWFLWIPWICNTAEHFISPRRWQIYCGHLWPPVCAQGLCAITSANCNMYKQIFTKAGAHLKTKRSSSPVPVQTQGSSCSHLTDTGPGAEVGLSPFFFPFQLLLPLPNEAPAICEHWTAQAELEDCCRTDSCNDCW